MKREYTFTGILILIVVIVLLVRVNINGSVSVARAQTGWIINEFLADPAGDLTGDANGDGTRDSSKDEFVEIVNDTGAGVDIGGWTLADSVRVRHTFPAGTIVPDGHAIVVFGGGTPTGAFGGSIVQIALTGAVGLNNSGDTITLADDTSSTMATCTYGSEGGNDQSLTRDPDITGSFVSHSTATGSGGALFSPGTKIDGTFFTAANLAIFKDVIPTTNVAYHGLVTYTVTINILPETL